MPRRRVASRSSSIRTRSAVWRCSRRGSTAASRETIAAVTGTNGKTSVAHFTREIWTALGHPAASLGTLGLVSPEGTAARRADDAGPGRAASRSGGIGRGRDRARRDRGVEPRSGAIPARRHRSVGRGIHQFDARSSRLSRRHGIVSRGETAAFRRAAEAGRGRGSQHRQPRIRRARRAVPPARARCHPLRPRAGQRAAHRRAGAAAGRAASDARGVRRAP